ncbi:MAG: hypothetical protein NTV86_00125 [Planctomycetota bacterium]|nr:hypothetical protein [Planctomycetota bacterium]
MARPDKEKKKGVLGRLFRRETPEDADRRKLEEALRQFGAEREEILDDRRGLMEQIDRLSARARSKKKEVDAATGPKKMILDRELRAILRPLQGLTKQDNQFEIRLGELDTLIFKAEETLSAQSSAAKSETIENLLDVREDTIADAEERKDLIGELTGQEFAEAEENVTTEDMLASLGLDLSDEKEKTKATEVVQGREVAKEPETTEPVAKRSKELDRLMEELENEGDE